MKGNRQIGLDGRVFISDCLSDGIFFVYSIIFSGILGAAGDIMKLLGKSSYAMNLLTNGLIIMDLMCCLGLIMVAYYVYFMNCGENMPRLGVKPLIYLEYARLAYYGMLIYDVLYRFADAMLHGGRYPIAMSVFYCVYLGWLVSCSFAAMFILTILNQNMIRRSYSDSFKMLALIGLSINIVMPLVFFITKIWIKGGGDGFYSSGLCDFIRLGLAPIFYAAVWFIFLNAIDQVDRVFSEVDNAIRDKNYRIEFEDEQTKKALKKAEKLAQSAARKARKASSKARKIIEANVIAKPDKAGITDVKPDEPKPDVTPDVDAQNGSVENSGANKDNVISAGAKNTKSSRNRKKKKKSGRPAGTRASASTAQQPDQTDISPEIAFQTAFDAPSPSESDQKGESDDAAEASSESANPSAN